MLGKRQERLRDPGAAQARAVHARHSGRVPHRQPHSDARREHRGASDSRRAGRQHHVRPVQHVLGRQPRAGDDSSPWASCPTSARRSSCSCSPFVWPYLERLSKEGELGRRKITQYTRYSTILLCVIQSMAIAIFLERQTNIAGGLPLVYEPGWSFRLMTVLTLTTGTAFIMWLGEQITERGIGNGMSADHLRGDRRRPADGGAHDPGSDAQRGHRPVHADCAGGRDGRGNRRGRVHRARTPSRDGAVRQAGRGAPHVRRHQHAHPAEGEYGRRHPGDLRFVDSGGFRRTAATAFPVGGWFQTVTDQLQNGMPAYYMLFIGGIIFFAYFYTAIIFNPDDVAENMRKYGGFIPGIRPGKRDRGAHRHDPDPDHLRRLDLPGPRGGHARPDESRDSEPTRSRSSGINSTSCCPRSSPTGLA